MNKEEVKIVDEDVKAILAEAIADYEKRTGKTLQPAHIERSIIQTYAYREMLVRKGINEAFWQTFPQFATGLALDLCGEIMGCYRLANQPARTTVRFSIEGEHSQINIPKGTQIAVNENLYFSTLVDVFIRATEQYVDIEAQANLSGSIGNGWEAGRLKTLKTAFNVPLKVSNLDETAGGIDTESDDDYRKRILLAPEAFTTCGTKAAYEYHTRSVSQYISDVAVLTPDGGQVEIVVLTKNGLPTPALLKQIQDYVADEKRRTLCDSVRVVAATEVSYQIEATLDLFANVVDEKTVIHQAEQAIRYYLSSRYELGLDVIPLAIASILRVDGVYNVHLTKPSLTEISEREWANCTAIRLNVGEHKIG